MTLTLNAVTKKFGEKIVLDNVSLSVARGEILCIMGASGCGKTTLLNIVMGLLAPDSGSVTGVPQSISAVFQEDRLCEQFTPRGNIISVTGNKIPLSETDALLSDLGIYECASLPVSRLSGGQRRRVCIARALAANSSLLILDEPFKGLDGDMRDKVIKTVSARAAGKTVLLATHDGREASLLGARIFRLA